MIDLLQIVDTLAQTTKFAAGDSNHDGTFKFF